MGKVLDIYEKELKDIRQTIESGGGTKLKEAIEKAAKEIVLIEKPEKP